MVLASDETGVGIRAAFWCRWAGIANGFGGSVAAAAGFGFFKEVNQTTWPKATPTSSTK
jgi:hypothetical protein